MSDLTDFDKLWNYDDPAASEQVFRALLPAAERTGDSGARAELLSQIARAEGLQGNFAAAHQTLDQAQALLGAEQRPRVRYLLERGRVFNSAGLPNQAQPLFQSAWELARRAGEQLLAIDAAHMLAIAAPPDERLSWNMAALQLAEASADERAVRWRASLRNNIGWAHHDAGRFAEALAMFEQALQIREQAGDQNAAHVARWCVARALRSLGRADEALARQLDLKAGMEARGHPDGYVYEEIAECLHALGRVDEARPFFRQAYAELSNDAWLAKGESARLDRLKILGGSV